MGEEAAVGLPRIELGSPIGLVPGLWTIAIAFFGVGDLLTTAVGLSFRRTVEAGPLTSIAIDQYGLPIVVPLKVLTLALAYLLWRQAPAPQRIGVPLGLATLGVLVTFWNLAIVVVVL
ncbi:MAG: hypothetical protein ABEH59_11625 [Halobacteriales archaeon]